MSESFSVRPCAAMAVFRISCRSPIAPSSRMKTSGPLASIEPAGVMTFRLLSAAKSSEGDTPRVASRLYENSTKILSAWAPMRVAVRLQRVERKSHVGIFVVHYRPNDTTRELMPLVADFFPRLIELLG